MPETRDWSFSWEDATVWANGKSAHLKPGEADVLDALLSRNGAFMTTEGIEYAVDPGGDCHPRSIYTKINGIRRALESIEAPVEIQHRPGRGYRVRALPQGGA